MRARLNQVSTPNPEFGVDFDASARAMHQSALKGSLMVHEKAFSTPAASRKSLEATLFERNTMLKTLKRKIALVAVAALGTAGLAVVVAPSANAAGGTAVTAISTSATAVRVSYTSTTLDAVGLVPLTITNAATYAIGTIGGGDEATITLTSAPSAAARLIVASSAAAGQVGAADGAAADFATPANSITARTLSLSAATKSIQQIVRVTATGGTSKIWVAADTVGTYSGTILLDNAVGGGQQETATFSFTTTGVPASITLASTAQSVPAGGRSSWSATVKDANGNATILGIYDSIGVTCSPACTAGNAANGIVDNTTDLNNVSSITATRIAAGSGTAGVVHRASGTAGASTTISFKALGVISALGTQTATVTETAQTIDTSQIIATPTITTTPAAGTVTGAADGGGVNGWVRTAAIKTGTSAVTFGFTAPTAGLGKEFRFGIIASAGTVDGVAYTTTVYKTAVADATTGKGSISFTLGGAALLTGATVTVRQVDVINTKVAPGVHATGLVNATLGDVRGNLITLTQTNAAFDADGATLSPSGAVVAKLGATTQVTVSLANTYGEALGAGYEVRAYRTSTAGTLLGTALTNASGEAKVSVTNAATLTAAGSETYVFDVVPPVGNSPGVQNATLVVNYTTTGTVTSISMAITNAGGTPTTPITNATLASSVLRIPIVYIPSDGYANTAGERSRILATATTAAADDAAPTVTASGAGEYFTLVASPSSATAVTWTGTDGVRFCSSTTGSPTATSCAWDAGKTTVTAASTNFIHVYSIKTGTQTVTAAVGDVKATMSFVARNRVIDGYNISLTPATQTLDSGAYGTVNVKVTDIFGNAVAAAAGDVTVSVTGPALLSGLAASASPATSATAGSEGANLTIIASTTGSGDATVAGAPGAATAATAWATTYVKPTNAPDPVKAASAKVTVKAAAASTAQTAETTAIKADVKAVSDTVATLSKAVTTIQSSVTELTSSFATQIKSLTDAIAKISAAIAALSKKVSTSTKAKK